MKPLNILVTGTAGQVDTEFAARADGESDLRLTRIGLPECDLGRPETLRAPVLAARPDIVISSAAMTAVDRCEAEEDLAMRVNAQGPAVLAGLAAELGIPIIHLSTDYVFSGEKSSPWREDDAPAPINAYGRSKLAGERGVRAANANHVILRTSWVYSAHGTNFVKTMLRLASSRDEIDVVADQRGCPSAAAEIARGLGIIARRLLSDADPDLRGTFHMAGAGETDWAGFAEAIFAGARQRGAKAARVIPIPAAAWPALARRPANSCLNCDRLRDIHGFALAPWRASLGQCLDQLLLHAKEIP